MIRTLIEVTAETQWDFDKNLEAALGKLGFEPKRSEEDVRWISDIFHALREKDIEPSELVTQFRAKIMEKQSQ